MKPKIRTDAFCGVTHINALTDHHAKKPLALQMPPPPNPPEDLVLEEGDDAKSKIRSRHLDAGATS